MKLNRYDDSWKNIWRNSKHAPGEEKWKWDHYIWKSVLDKIWVGDVDHLVCPICNQEKVYFKYLIFSEHEFKGEKKMMADLWVGCEYCNIQIRETATIPSWLKEPEWSPKAEELRNKLNS